jgi:hypothetical protein
VGLAAIPDPIALDVGLTARSCHKSVIINRLIKKKKQRKKPI